MKMIYNSRDMAVYEKHMIIVCNLDLQVYS